MYIACYDIIAYRRANMRCNKCLLKWLAGPNELPDLHHVLLLRFEYDTTANTTNIQNDGVDVYNNYVINVTLNSANRHAAWEGLKTHTRQPYLSQKHIKLRISEWSVDWKSSYSIFKKVTNTID